MASSIFFYFPSRAAAQSPFSFLAGGVCNVYSATIEKVIDKAKDRLREKAKKVEDAANKKAEEATKSLLGKAGLGKAGSLLGNEVPVVDTAVEAAVGDAKISIQQTQRNIDCKTKVERILLSVLKKRILDVMVDQTINWINGNGSPKFVTDFGGFLQDTAQSATGDVVRDIGLAQLCTGIQPQRIQIQIERPVFSQAVSCTLNQIVGNVERFGQSFQNGGWIGYQELLKPQNNRYGVELLAQGEVARRISEETTAALQELTAGQGFRATKECLEWTVSGTSITDNKFETKQYSVSNTFNYPDPASPPPDSAVSDFASSHTDVSKKCTKAPISTPGQLLVGATQKAVTLQADYVINAETLQDYAAAIIDAGLNRLIQAGVKGLGGVVRQAGPSGGYYTRSNIPSSVNESAEAYRGATINEIMGGSKENIISQLNDASTTLADLEKNLTAAPALNDQIATTTAGFVSWCDSSTLVGTVTSPNRQLHPQTCALFTTSTVANIEGRAQTITELALETIGKKSILPSLITQVNAASGDALKTIIPQVLQFIQDVSKLLENSAPFSDLDNDLLQLQALFTTCQNASPQDPSCP